MVEFQLLGDVEARSGGQRLEVGHARQRCVLAALLVDVNRAVSADQLIDRVWADEPPHRPKNALAAYVSRLRLLLAQTGGATIAREHGGYLLSTDALSVDLHRFRHLASEARVATDPTAAAALFDEALGLWQGEPFGSLDTPWVNDVRTSLAAEHLSVELDRNDVCLRIGRHADLLVGLTACLQANPLDERVAGQLMLALHRSGRQADALDTYRRMRDRLVEELGVDPSPRLQAVHQQILDGDHVDPTPMSPAQPEPSGDGPAFTGLPRRPTSLIGREREVHTVTTELDEGPLVTLTGVGGVGKTRLAVEVGKRSQDRFENGVRFCELAPLDDGSAVTQAVAATLRVPEKPGLGIDGTIIDYLQGHELLLIVDNCEHVLETAAQLIDRIVRNCPRVSVLVTSREPLGIEGERVVSVPPLHEDDAIVLFAERARASRPGFDADHEPVGAVAEICRRLDGVPLAIELAAARMRVMSSLDVARRLDRLRLLSGGARGAHPRQQSVAATIDWSYRLLAEPEQTLFARLSVFAGSFDLEAAHGVCAEADAGEDDTFELLAGLVDKSMVIVRDGSHTTTRYGVLETLRAYGRERLQENALADELASRHARYYVELLERAAAGMHGADEAAWVERMTPDAGTTYTAPDFDNLRAAFERAMAVGDVDLALRLVTSLPEVMHMRIGYHSISWVVRAVELADPDHPLFAAAVGTVARGTWVLGEFAHARSLASLAAGRVPGLGTPYIAYPADVLADVALYEGDAAAALAHYDAEAVSARGGADPIRLVLVLDKLTICHQALGTPEAGLPAAQEALRVADATANPTARSLARCALGRALAESEPQRALGVFDQAAELAASVENNWLTGIASMEAAAIRAVHGDPATAARTFVEVLDHWGRGGPGIIAQQWDTLRYVARLLVRLGADDDAAALHRALVDAGRESPLSAAQVDRLGGAVAVALTGAEAVALARMTLQRYC